MAIKVSEIKKKTKVPEGVDALFYFSLFLFFLVGAFYLFMLNLNLKAEEKKVEIEQAIENKKAEIPEKKDLEETAQKYFNLVEDFKLISENRRVTSSFFGPFEKMVHPEVFLFEAEINLDENEGIFSGEGEDLVVVGQQFHFLKNNESVLNVELTELTVSREEEKVLFSFSIKFNEELFRFQLKEND